MHALIDRTLATVENTLGPQILNRYNMFRAASLNAEPGAGTSTGVVMAQLEAAAQEAEDVVERDRLAAAVHDHGVRVGRRLHGHEGVGGEGA